MNQFTVLHTIETGGPGGAETVMLELASQLNPERFRSVALLPGGNWLPQQLESRRVPVFISDSRAWYDPTLIRAMNRIVRREKVDLIHSHLPGQNFYSCLVGKFTRHPIVVTYHGARGLSENSGFRESFKSWVVRQSAAAVVLVSDYLKRSFESAGFPSARTVRIYNGVDMGRFGGQRNGGVRAELGVDGNTKLVGMIANLRRAKGYDHFVRAARLIADEIPESRFIAVGEGDNAIAGELKDLIHQLHLENKFFFLGFRSDIPAILNGLDVFVLSSTDEGLSIATIEAMAAGRPVVVTRSGGPEEIVEDGKTGFLVPPADPRALAARVCDILRDPNLAVKLGQEARQDVREKFSLSRMVSAYESLYLRCLGCE